MKTAFSTISCPHMTFEHVAQLAERLDVDGVELRTFGTDQSPMACEPWQTGAEKIRTLFRGHGVGVSSIATSIRFDTPVFPPVLGYALVRTDTHPSVRDARDCIALATALEAPYVRVFGFEPPAGESRVSGLDRIAQRLSLALACARHTGVRLVIENGGAYPKAEDLNEIMDLLDHSLLAASYSTAVASLAGENPAHGISMLGSRLACVKLRDFTAPDEHGLRHECTLGNGVESIDSAVSELARQRFKGWLVVEHDRLWSLDESVSDADVESQLKASFQWLARAWGGSTASKPAPQMA